MALARLDEFADLLRRPARPEVAVCVRRRENHVLAAVSADGTEYPVVDGQPALIEFSKSVLSAPESIRRPLVRRRAGGLRVVKSRMMDRLGTTSQSRAHMTRLATMLARSTAAPLVLVIGGGARGAGTEPLYEHPIIRTLAFDIYASPHTQLIADAHEIPLADACLDGVVIQAVLEHVLDPVRVVNEIHRVLKPGGLVYAETPFMQQVHEGAYDFTRFTELGHRWLFRDFEAIDRGTLGGPGLSFYWSARYFFRALARSRAVGEILALPFALASLLDRVADIRHGIDGANGVYLLGRRLQDGAVCPGDIASAYLGAQR